MAWASIVDYLKANKIDPSFANRAKLAAQYGIKNYRGTAQQNIALLNYLQKRQIRATQPIGGVRPMSSSKQKTNAAPTKSKGTGYMGISAADSAWYNNYSKALVSGTADPTQYQRYLNLSKKYNLKRYNISENALRQLSLKALAGDKKAQNYLKAMHINPMTGQSLWKGITKDQLNSSGALRWAYMKDNPYADYTRNYDYANYQQYNQALMNGKPLSPSQLQWYKNVVQKWHLDDLTDPLMQQKYKMQQEEQQYLNQLEKDRQAALNAQDVALNNALAQADNNNFQQFLDVQQQMADRGLTGSGIAADAYLRSQMAANQAYQDAFTQAAQNKANIQADYTDKIAQTKANYTKDITSLVQAIQERDVNAALALQARQDERDKFLTQQTGIVYLNGKPLTGKDGKPITTLEYQKLLETQRHNQATEMIDATKVDNDYKLGQQRNAITQQGNMLNYKAKMAQIELDKQRIAADQQIAYAKLKLAYAQLDLNRQKFQASINEAKAKLDIMARNAATSEMKAKISAIKTELSALQKQIDARRKAGHKPTSAQKKQLKALMDQLEALVSGK